MQINLKNISFKIHKVHLHHAIITFLLWNVYKLLLSATYQEK